MRKPKSRLPGNPERKNRFGAFAELSCCRNDQNQPGNGQEIFRRQKKADEEAKILLSARTKEIKEKIANIGKSGAEKLSIGVEGAIGYCAKVSAQAEERLAEYKNNVKKSPIESIGVLPS